MKFFSLLILLLTLVACGKDSMTNSTSSTLSINGLTMNTATITVPAANVYGGGISISIKGQSYQIDTSKSSSEVQMYLHALNYGQINVSPISSNQVGKTYRAAYAGSLQQGVCTTNPNATCTNAILTQLMAY